MVQDQGGDLVMGAAASPLTAGQLFPSEASLQSPQTHHTDSPTADVHDSNNQSRTAFSALQDFLSSQSTSNGNHFGPYNLAAVGHDQSPNDFADLLAEFTSSGTVLSPEAAALGQSPGVSAPDGSSVTIGEEGSTLPRKDRSRATSAATGFASIGGLGSPLKHSLQPAGMEDNTGSEPLRAAVTQMQASNQLAQAIASMNASTQSQLLAALLSRQPGSQSFLNQNDITATQTLGESSASTPTSKDFNTSIGSVEQRHPPSSYAKRQQQDDSPIAAAQSPHAFSSSQPSSQHNSPQTFSTYNPGPSPHILAQSYPSPHPPPVNMTPLPSAMTQSTLPSPFTTHPAPSAAYLQQLSQHLLLQQHAQKSLALAQAHAQAQQVAQQHQFQPLQYQQQQQQPQQQEQQQQQQQQNYNTASMAFQNAFSPRQFASHRGTQPQPTDVQTQMAMEMLNMLPGGSGSSNSVLPGQGADMRMRGASATGGSYATNADTEDWGDTDFMFSPLMSPALTPHSVFTQASSLPPSAGGPSASSHNMPLVSPAEFFSPLGSPAIMPQSFNDSGSNNNNNENHTAAAWAQAHHTHSNSLQGLVDQTKALAFDSSAFGTGTPSSYFLGQHHPIPLTTGVGAGVSPRMVATGSSNGSPGGNTTPGATTGIIGNDAGAGTATGSGRRGASSSKKTRPSPLLKPTPDNAIRKRKTVSSSTGTGSEKRGSSLGRTAGEARSATTSPLVGPTMYGRGAVTANNLTSAGSRADSNGTSGSRTSPTDAEASSGSQSNTPSPVDMALNDGASKALMGPPPLPSSLSRRTSLHQHELEANEITDVTPWMNPVTPASFMNFPSELAIDGLSSLSPHVKSGMRTGSHSGASSVNASPLLLPSDHGTSSSSTITKIKRKSSTSKKSMSDSSSPAFAPASSPSLAASKPTSEIPLVSLAPMSSAKGKNKVAPVTAQRRVVAKPLASKGIAPSPKIKPLLANGLPPDAFARLSTKSNYQNIMDGRGADLLGFTPSTLSALNANHAPGADNRRTSHKAAEQKRRDSLKQCFEELRRILPPLALTINDEDRRPGEGNVGGQRSGSVDPENPNRGVSKVALLRRSNEYVGMLHDRIDRRDQAIGLLRAALEGMRNQLGGVEEGIDLEGLDLDNLDKDEKAVGTMESYECLDSDDDDVKPKPTKRSLPGSIRRKSNANDADSKTRPTGSRRSTRNSNASVENNEDDSAMEVEGV